MLVVVGALSRDRILRSIISRSHEIYLIFIEEFRWYQVTDQ